MRWEINAGVNAWEVGAGCQKTADTSPVNAVSTRDDRGKAGPFSVERLKTDLPFSNVVRVQASAQRSAGPLGVEWSGPHMRRFLAGGSHCVQVIRMVGSSYNSFRRRR